MDLTIYNLKHCIKEIQKSKGSTKLYQSLVYIFSHNLHMNRRCWLNVGRLSYGLFTNNCMPFMWQTKPHNQTFFLDLLMLFYENKSKPHVNQALPLEKLLTSFLRLFQTHHNQMLKTWLKYFPPFAWKCVVPLPLPNVFWYNNVY
jgi:hypothetical protein